MKPNRPQQSPSPSKTLTESDVDRLIREVEGETLLDPDTEREWTEAQLKSLRLEEQQTIYSFRMFKALRDDDRMIQSAEALRKIRGAKAHLEDRLKTLE